MVQPHFTTDRLILRPRQASDLEDSVAINRDPEVMRYLGAVWPPERQQRVLAKLGFADAGAYEAGGKIERLYRRLA